MSISSSSPRTLAADGQNGTEPYAGFQGKIERVVAKSEPWWPPTPKAPRGAPNVIVMLVDDMGFSDLGCYGSEIDTPNLDRLARETIHFSNYHVTPMCSPTRAALLTGLNPHYAGVGEVGDDYGFPGYMAHLADNTQTMADVFRANGYATFLVGKWHLDGNSPREAYKEQWPLQRGFDRFHGFLDGLTTYHCPRALVEDNHILDVERFPDGYFFTDDVTDRAIQMIATLRGPNPDKPFFLYFAHGAPHAPLQAKRSDIEKYRGAYDVGWDEIRVRRYRRQLELGVIFPGTKLAPRNSEPGHAVKAWDSLPEKERRLFARYMECYAALIDNIDQNFGRLRAALEVMGEWENTIFVFHSDNGASREGQVNGTSNYFKGITLTAARSGTGNAIESELDEDYRWLEEMGGPRTFPHYPMGWAMACNTPFRLYKINTHAGGHQSPLIFSWPAKGLQGGIRGQYAFVTDVLPTLVDLVGLRVPPDRNGKPVKPIQGKSFGSILLDPKAPAVHTEQYYELWGHRGYYRDGWEVVTLHLPRTPYSQDHWELYDLTKDPSETQDRSGERPEKVKELVEAWERAARENQVFPLDERVGLKPLQLAAAGLPGRAAQRLVLLPGAPTVQYAGRFIAQRSFDITVNLDFSPGDEGILVSHGDQGGGYALYIEGGKLTFAYNWYGEMRELSGGTVPPGAKEIRLEAHASGKNLWDMRLSIGGRAVTAGQGFRMLAALAPWQGISIGLNPGSPVSWDLYQRHGTFRYRRKLTSVVLTPGAPAPDRNPNLLQQLLEQARKFE